MFVLKQSSRLKCIEFSFSTKEFMIFFFIDSCDKALEFNLSLCRTFYILESLVLVKIPKLSLYYNIQPEPGFQTSSLVCTSKIFILIRALSFSDSIKRLKVFSHQPIRNVIRHKQEALHQRSRCREAVSMV